MNTIYQHNESQCVIFSWRKCQLSGFRWMKNSWESDGCFVCLFSLLTHCGIMSRICTVFVVDGHAIFWWIMLLRVMNCFVEFQAIQTFIIIGVMNAEKGSFLGNWQLIYAWQQFFETRRKQDLRKEGEG